MKNLTEKNGRKRGMMKTRVTIKALFLLLFVFGQYIYPQKHELKIYRNVSKIGFLSSMGIGVIGFYISGGVLVTEALAKGVRNIDPVIGGSHAAIFIGSQMLFHSYLKWFFNRHKPILIFDEEGFTYEKPMGWFRGRQDVRYLWKEVVSHWVTGVVNEHGTEIKKTWNYHIAGERNPVSINVLELDIPNELKARVESLRQGRVRALLE